jgi:lipoyl synthase
MSVISPIPNPSPLPRWLKRNVPKGNANHFTAKLIGKLGLQTVCDHAKCPNRMECYSQKTATFMILGNICTRACRFCGVPKGRPLPVDEDEPRRVAEAVKSLGLQHVVITCVTRDDLPDGGAEQFCKTIEAVRRATSATIEVLPSDFAGNTTAVDRLIEAAPEVYNHNTETAPRLFPPVRNKGVRTVFLKNSSDPFYPDYAWTLEMFRRIRRANPAIALKTGLMLGLGETTEELLDTLADLYEAGCQRLTLGQYLQPSPAQIPVVRYLPPEEFDELGDFARRMGYEHVASGPFVRSSYHAREMMNAE